jgi:hypothetical protein
MIEGEKAVSSGHEAYPVLIVLFVHSLTPHHGNVAFDDENKRIFVSDKYRHVTLIHRSL